MFENSKWRTSGALRGPELLEATTLNHDFLHFKQGHALAVFVHLLLL